MSIITKGLIGTEDMNLGTGTFTRSTSTGGTNTLHQVDMARLTSTSTQTFAGPLSFAAVSLNNVLYAEQFAGADIGAKINAAYAALPAGGGTIMVGPPATGAEYNFTTPIVLATAGKYVRLEGAGASGAQSSSVISGVILNYTPTSGTAITMDYVSNSISPLSSSHGIRNITLVNNNQLTTGSSTGTAIGIAVGTTNSGIYGASMENVSIIGFNVGFKNANNNSVQVAWYNPQFFSNAAAIIIDSMTGLWLFGGQIAGNTTGIKAFGASSSAEILLYGTEFFGNTTIPIDWTPSSATGILDCFGVHFETSPTGSTSHMINGNLDIYLSGGVMEDDTPSVTHDWMINTGGNRLIIEGTRFLTGLGSTITQIVVANAPVRGIMRGFISSAGHFTNYVTGTNAGKISVEMLSGNSTVASTPWTLENLGIPGQYNSIATVSNGVPAEYATVDLTGQTAAIAATTLYTPAATGMFRITAYLKITTTGTSPVLGPLTITYTDGTDSVAQSVVMSQQLQTGATSNTGNNGNTTISVLTGSLIIYAKTGVAIQYAVALTGTVGATQYEVHMKCEAL